MPYDLSHILPAPLAFALQQLDGWTAFETVSHGMLIQNPLLREFCYRLDKDPLLPRQRYYLAQIASRTASDDALGGSPESFWRMLRDASAKRLPLLEMQPTNMKALREIIVFERIAIGNARILTGLAPIYAVYDLPAHDSPAEFEGGLREFFDVMEGCFFPHLETFYAAATGQAAQAAAMEISQSIKNIQRHVHEGIRDDMAGLDIIGPIDPARFAALSHKTDPALSPVR